MLFPGIIENRSSELGSIISGIATPPTAPDDARAQCGELLGLYCRFGEPLQQLQ